MVDLLERLDAMLQQEAKSYVIDHYLDSSFQDNLTTMKTKGADFYSVSTSDASSASSTKINEVWREKICEWSYQVVDHFDFSRELVSVSINILDRYLAKHSVNKKAFQLAAMSALFIAIKVNEPNHMSIQSMIELSRGYFTLKQMERMELSILSSLRWKINPPTAFCFAKHLLFLLPSSSVPHHARHTVLELTRFLTELSVIDYFFVTQRPSDVAASCLVYAMNAIPGISKHAIDDFVAILSQKIKLDMSCITIQGCSARIGLLYEQGNYCPPINTLEEEESRDESHSPVCVSFGLKSGCFLAQTNSECRSCV